MLTSLAKKRLDMVIIIVIIYIITLQIYIYKIQVFVCKIHTFCSFHPPNPELCFVRLL